MNAPTLSGTSQQLVLRPSTTFNYFDIDKAGILSIGYKFGGLQATVTGTGGATGSAQMGAGLSFFASASLGSAGGSIFGGVTARSAAVPPFYTSSNFAITTPLNANITLTGT